MKIDNIDIEATIERARALIDEDKHMPAATKSMFEVLILLISLLANRLGLNSNNSSKPPSSDPNREKKTKSKTGKKPGGQKGHIGTNLQPVKDPDRVKEIKIDRSKLPAGWYHDAGYEARQVFDIDISRRVTEYRAQVHLVPRSLQAVLQARLYPRFVQCPPLKGVDPGLGARWPALGAGYEKVTRKHQFKGKRRWRCFKCQTGTNIPESIQTLDQKRR